MPFTVAEGLAAKHNIPREIFLKRIQGQMTAGEKLRLQGSSEKAGIKLEITPEKLPLTKLALYILSLDLKTRRERREELEQTI